MARMFHDHQRTIAGDDGVEIEIRKSRFICTLFRVTSESAARTAIEGTRRATWNASHHCTAWRIGRHGRQQRSNDDGEPAGTAGIPMLEVLIQRELTDLVAIVTRYFGGTKLGAGGLARAYGAAVSAAIDHVGIVERRPQRVTEVAVPHGTAGRLEHALHSSMFDIASVSYTADDVTLVVHLDPARLESFSELVSECTSGDATVRDAGVLYVDVPLKREDDQRSRHSRERQGRL